MPFNRFLDTVLDGGEPACEPGLKEAMLYSLSDGGKRVRPLIFFALSRHLGHTPERYYHVAAALEMTHTYSLIHDDLPAMDNDSLRRGRPTSHIQFSESTAILAGDALLTHAFYLLSVADFGDPVVNIRLVQLLSSASGAGGMVAGQYLDMQSPHLFPSRELLENIHRKKTGCLILCAFQMALTVCNASKELWLKWTEFGKKLGIFFQLRDDLMDVRADVKALGKQPGGDDKDNKLTYPALIGLEASDSLLDELYKSLMASLHQEAAPVPVFEEILESLYRSCTATQMKLTKRAVEKIFNRFAQYNPHPQTELKYDSPFQLLIAVILSAQCTDAAVNKATPALFAEAPTAKDMVQLGVPRIRELIATIGLNNAKSRHIHACSQILQETYSGQLPQTRAELENLPGVGKKTAGVVMNVVYGSETLPVDTHVFRVSNRLGLVSTKTPEATEDHLIKVIPRPRLRYAHHWLILHGRYICKARKPLCGACFLADICPSAVKE
ncbi:hypothetical protein CHS0354_006887 [Potamilus streckersoni]|uniref:HhH-GPD domain-containing protein n=1 Tax=Potamilus streckersoni TaxID=2493646 RepID=A0AAE0TEM5_9BIVA|nr:hypothetical protein CHS0354_006887 [Potamilus streckersoni]